MTRCCTAALFLLCLLLACLPPTPVHAADDDTRYLIDQTRRANERLTEPVEEPPAPPGSVAYEGQIYEVQNTPQDLEPAIYIALNTGQWDRLLEFIGRYRLLRDSKPELLGLAEGLLARQQGDYPHALQHLQAAHAANPANARIRLELARLQFEDNRDADARASFEQALQADLPDYGRELTRQYLEVLQQRAGWHGSLAVGLGHNDNINQANGYDSCLSEFMGICLFERVMPEPIGSNMVSYEAALERRFNLAGNHNLLVRPLSYGSFYHRKDTAPDTSLKNYSNSTSLLYLGYQYLDTRNNIEVLPYVEHYYRDSYTNYLAEGLQLGWRRALGTRWQLEGRLDGRRYHHKTRAQMLFSDYSQYQASLTVSYMPDFATAIYGGLDATRKKYSVPQASTKEWALRAGVYHAFDGDPGIYLNAMGVLRYGRSDAYDGFLDARHRDRQQVYIVTLGAGNWKIAGMTPELRWRRSVNHSNVDWAFDFSQNEISLMLRHTF